MKIRPTNASVGVLIALAGCEHRPPVEVQTAPAPAQHASSGISQAAREQLTGKVDMGAVDRLVETLGPEERARFLQSFEDVEHAAKRTDHETREVRIIVRYGDAERQRLLDQVWAPFWSHLPPSVLADASYPLPGRSLATVRRHADSLAAHRREREP